MGVAKVLKFGFIIKDSRYAIAAVAITAVLFVMTPASDSAQDS